MHPLRSNPHASPLALEVMERWEELRCFYWRDSPAGRLSVAQVARVLLPPRAPRLGVAKTLHWLARRGHLRETVDHKGRHRFSRIDPE